MRRVAVNFSGVGRKAFPPPFWREPSRFHSVLPARGGGAVGVAGREATPFFVGESPPLVGFPVGRSGRSRKRGPWPARNLAFLVAVENVESLANCSLRNKPPSCNIRGIFFFGRGRGGACAYQRRVLAVSL